MSVDFMAIIYDSELNDNLTVCFHSGSLTVDSVRQTHGLTWNVAQPNVRLDA